MAIDPIANANTHYKSGGAPIDPASVHRSLNIDNKRARAEAVASQLEKVFMEMMVKSMRATVKEDGLFGKSMGGSNYIEMLDQQYAQLEGIPKDPRFHEVLVRQILRTPEETSQALQRMKEEGSPTPAASLQQAQGKKS